MMFGARPPFMEPIFRRCWTQHFVHWKRNCSQAGQAIEQFQNRRVTQLRIGGVSHLSVGKNVEPESAFRSERQLVFGRLAVDQKPAATRLPRASYAPALLRSSPTTNSSPKLLGS